MAAQGNLGSAALDPKRRDSCIRRATEAKYMCVVRNSHFEPYSGPKTSTFILSGIALMAFLVAGGTASAQNQIERGMKVYADQKCAVCHAIGGKGNAKGALDDVGSRLSADDIRMWIVNPVEMTKKTNAERKPPMRAYPNLPKDDVDTLVAYMLSLKKK
jgi:mono/diheme cytochrome c family protein